MFKRENTESDSNFWISYADLMAGLLFVFILLIGAIISKSIILQNILSEKDKLISNTTKSLAQKEHYILEKNKLLAKKNEKIKKDKALLSKKSMDLEEKNAKIVQNTLRLSDKERLLKLKLSEIAKLNIMLKESEARANLLDGKIVLVREELNSSKSNSEETLEKFKNKMLKLSDELNESKNDVKEKDKELSELRVSIKDKTTKYDDLISSYRAQKIKIKSLTGIKLKVVTALKKALGKKINIDKKSGSLKLASNILFSVGKSTLKRSAKKELKKAFEDYIGTLIKDKDIKPHLDKIIIEGHTDSDGGYIYNLKLSQSRALAVMEYLLTLNFSKTHNIKPLMVASGRAYLDAVKVNDIEDKEASRRIEIKFKLKNEDAMHEIEKVLDAN